MLNWRSCAGTVASGFRSPYSAFHSPRVHQPHFGEPGELRPTNPLAAMNDCRQPDDVERPAPSGISRRDRGKMIAMQFSSSDNDEVQ